VAGGGAGDPRAIYRRPAQPRTPAPPLIGFSVVDDAAENPPLHRGFRRLDIGDPARIPWSKRNGIS